jgi:hypothetical protein
MRVLCGFNQVSEVVATGQSAMHRRAGLQAGRSADAHHATVIERRSAVGALSNAGGVR